MGDLIRLDDYRPDPGLGRRLARELLDVDPSDPEQMDAASAAVDAWRHWVALWLRLVEGRMRWRQHRGDHVLDIGPGRSVRVVRLSDGWHVRAYVDGQRVRTSGPWDVLGPAIAVGEELARAMDGER